MRMEFFEWSGRVIDCKIWELKCSREDKRRKGEHVEWREYSACRFIALKVTVLAIDECPWEDVSLRKYTSVDLMAANLWCKRLDADITQRQTTRCYYPLKSEHKKELWFCYKYKGKFNMGVCIAKKCSQLSTNCFP